MQTTPFIRQAVAAVSAALLMAPAAFAAAPSQAKAQYEKDRAACLAGKTNQSQHDCLYEAQSVYNEARSGKLHGDDPATLAANALRRCQVQPAGPDRDACEKLVRGEGTTSGSVDAGGVLKELVTVTEMPAPGETAPR